MNKKKTEALTFPSNPLAAMRELQDLDPAPQINQQDEQIEASSEQTDSPSSNVKPGRQTESETQTDPVRQAILLVLSQPFQSDPMKGPFTVTTVKVPTAIWERLALFAQLTGEHKQEVLARALKEFLKPGKAKGGV